MKKIYLSCIMALSFTTTPLFSQENENDGGGGLCELGEPETEDVSVLDNEALKAEMDAGGGECSDQLAAGIAAYVDENMKTGQSVADAIGAAEEVVDKLNVKLSEETLSILKALEAKWGDRSEDEDATCNMAKNDPAYFDCKADKLLDEFGEDCNLEGLLDKNTKQQAKLDKVKEQINQVVQEIMKAKEAACSGG